MSSAGSKRAHEATADENERRVQTCSATAHAAAAAQRNRTRAAAVPSVSPVSMLYSHALESIFAFCVLTELAALLAVSRDWRSSVLKMRPIEGRLCIVSHLIKQMCASPLRRHVIGITQHVATDRIGRGAFKLLSKKMPHLQSLQFAASCSGPDALLIPARLRELSLTMNKSDFDSPLILEATLAQIVRLPELTALTFSSACTVWNVSIAPLLAMAQLRKLDLNDAFVSSDTVAVLRQLGQLHKLLPPYNLFWSVILAPGHRLQLRGFNDSNGMSQEDCDTLATLPSLTRVVLDRCDCTHFDCLTSLPQLQNLELSFIGSQQVDSPRVVAALRQCTQLTELSAASLFPWHIVFTSEQQLREVVQSLPLLRSLSLIGCTNIPSLSFLTSGPIASTLTDLRLSIFEPRLPVAELHHIEQLRALERIELIDVFERALTPAENALYTPPSHLMPLLRSFKCCE